MLFVQHLRHHYKCLTDVHICLCWGLNEVLNVVVFSKTFASLCSNFSFWFSVCLISHKDNDGIGFALGADLIAPVGKICETGQTCDTVCQKDGMSSSIEDLCDTLEGLLAGSVPDLELEYWSIVSVAHLEEKRAEFHAYCDFVVLAELVRGHSMHQTGFSHTWVSDDNQLE